MEIFRSWISSRIFLSVVCILLFSRAISAEEKRPPLGVEIWIAKNLKEQVLSAGFLEKEIRSAILRASDLFRDDVDREIIIRDITEVAIPDTLYSPNYFQNISWKYLDLDATLEWLKSLNHIPRQGALFTLIFIAESLNDRFSKVLYRGYAESPFALVRYSSDLVTMVDVILHEIGHLCKAEHHMGGTIGHYYTNKAKKAIKKNCG